MATAGRDRTGGAAAGAWRLVRLDLLVLRNGFAAAFSGWRDRLLLLIVLTLGLLWLRDAAAATRAAYDPRIVFAAGAVAGWTVGGVLRRRLLHQREEGILAADALIPVASLLYVLTWSAAAGTVLVASVAIAAPYDLLPCAGGLAAGGLARALVPDLPARGRIPSPPRGTRRRGSAAPVLLAATVAGVARLALARGGETDAALAAAALSGAFLAWLLRGDDRLARFHAIAGLGQWRSAARLLAPAASFALLSAALTAALAGLRAAAFPAIVAAILLLLALLRNWLFRLHPRWLADSLLGLACAATAMLVVAAPPVGAIFAIGLAVILYRRAGRATWLMD